jgi:S-sulfo-L-cysteine synthase (3-phospho-L-serine-dependent)
MSESLRTQTQKMRKRLGLPDKCSCLAFIESNTSGTGQIFAGKAAERGYLPVFLVEDPGRYAFLDQESFPFVCCRTGSLQELLSALGKLSSETAVAGVFSTSDYFLETAALLARACNLRGASPEALRAGRNKAIQRQNLKAAGLNTPEFICADSVEAAVAASFAIGLPVIVKPTLESGSFGVRLCATPEEVAAQAGWLLRRTVNARGLPIPHEVLVEEYLAGPEYSAEVFAGRVRGITRKHLSPEPFFVELGHDFPAALPNGSFDQIVKIVEHALRALDLDWGPAHVELRLHRKDPVIIEINPRLAGGFIPEIVRLASGQDMIDDTICLLAGDPIKLKPKKNAHASIRFLTSPREGFITRISGMAEARECESVAEIQMYRRAGEQVRRENDFRDRIGHVIACADSLDAAARCAELACRKIRIEVGP